MKANLTRARLSASEVLAALAVLFLLVSCWHPAFDPGISGSEAVIRKLGAPVLYFTAEDVEGWEMEDAWFLPKDSISFNAGILLNREESSLHLRSVSSIDAVNHTATVDDVSSTLINMLGDLYTAHPSPDGSNVAFFATQTDSFKYLNRFDSFADPAPLFTACSLPPTGVSTFGTGARRNDDITVNLIWIGMDSTSPQYNYIDWQTGTPTFTLPSPLEFDDAPFVAQAGKAFVTGGGTVFFLSCGLSDGSRAIYRWSDPSINPSRFPEVYGPLVGVLSDTWVLAEKKGILTVMDNNLKRLFSFPAGKLKFAYERYNTISGQMTAVFTRTIYVRTESGDDRGRLKVEVYEIPSADLYKLAD